MKRTILAAAAVLALAACADDGAVTGTRAPTGGPNLDKYYYSAETIFTTQTPAENNSTGGSAWEAGTRFTTTREGIITGFRFYKGAGETGTHTAKLWDSSGNLLASKTFSSESPSGWQSTFLGSAVTIPAGTYMVSVNTNTQQVKTFGYFSSNGTIYRSFMSADAGAYGQPAGNKPGTISGSAFFVDVYFSALRCDTVVDTPCP